jgi:hypothetical protein
MSKTQTNFSNINLNFCSTDKSVKDGWACRQAIAQLLEAKNQSGRPFVLPHKVRQAGDVPSGHFRNRRYALVRDFDGICRSFAWLAILIMITMQQQAQMKAHKGLKMWHPYRQTHAVLLQARKLQEL